MLAVGFPAPTSSSHASTSGPDHPRVGCIALLSQNFWVYQLYGLIYKTSTNVF